MKKKLTSNLSDSESEVLFYDREMSDNLTVIQLTKMMTNDLSSKNEDNYILNNQKTCQMNCGQTNPTFLVVSQTRKPA